MSRVAIQIVITDYVDGKPYKEFTTQFARRRVKLKDANFTQDFTVLPSSVVKPTTYADKWRAFNTSEEVVATCIRLNETAKAYGIDRKCVVTIVPWQELG